MGGREGLFLEKPDIVDKYCRRVIHEKNPQLAELSLIQFARMYQPIRRKTASDEQEEVDNFDDDVDINNSSDNRSIWKDREDRISNYYITVNPSFDLEPLPNIIKLKNCQPGEVSIWEKRLFPKAARFHKKK